MKYILLFYSNPATWNHPTHLYNAEVKTDEDRARLKAEEEASNKALEGSNEVGEGTALADPKTAKTINRRGGKLIVTDGPFIETREQLAGYFLLDCESMERAVAIVSTFPGLEYDSCEIRPVFEWSGEA
ncbi:MAG: YciI family protein [Thermomicrobiales bacterium]